MRSIKLDRKYKIKSIEQGYSGAKIASFTDIIYSDGKHYYIKPKGYNRYLWFNPLRQQEMIRLDKDVRLGEKPEDAIRRALGKFEPVGSIDFK